jgi:hypothetical protein
MSKPEKKPYVPPTITEYGALEELTAGGTGNANEGSPGKQSEAPLGVPPSLRRPCRRERARAFQLPVVEDTRPECVLTFQPPLALVDAAWDHLWRRPDGSVSLSCAKDGEDYALGFPGWGRAIVRDEGRSIEVLLEPDVPRETVEHLVCDQLLPRVAAFRGRLVLHAGASSPPPARAPSSATPASASRRCAPASSGTATSCSATTGSSCGARDPASRPRRRIPG